MTHRYETNREYSEHIYLLCPFGLFPLPSPRPLPPQPQHPTSTLEFLSLFSLIYTYYQFHEQIYVALNIAFHMMVIVFISVYTWLNFPPCFFRSPVSQIFVSSSWILFNNTVHLSLSPWYFDYLMQKLLQLFINRNMDCLLTSFPLWVLTNVPYGKLLAEFSKMYFRQWIHH